MAECGRAHSASGFLTLPYELVVYVLLGFVEATVFSHDSQLQTF